MNTDSLISTYRAAGQGQVFAFWESLDATARAELAAQAAEVDLAEIERLNRTLVFKAAGGGANLDGLAPAPCILLPEHGGDAAQWAAATARGEAALRAGRVAAFTVAGGQGTRLGYDGPKGTFAVTPLKAKTLFQVFAEKIKASGLRYGRPLHWFIMTSHANHAQTEVFFAENRHFGLDPGRVHFFRQGRMPAVGYDGKILLETPGTLALSPDGHGGSLRALHRSGALDLMQSEGVDTLSYFQVDNPLVRCVDPAFIGFHLGAGAEMSSKMVPKAYPEEKVGHFCLQDGKIVVVEYSDMPLSMQRETNPDRTLRYGAGSIAIHVIDREFARRLAVGGEDVALPFHRADKKIATIDAAGQPVKPTAANGVKFEMFVFDAIPFARNSIVIETARADDFSPVKNADGLDSPRTSREDQMRQFARWLQGAGVPVATDATGLPQARIEVSPLFGYDASTFAERWQALPVKPAVVEGLYLE
ncbi:putative uridylyltransferase [Lacunisphaera limnophila]|uniref:Putative uridylyltransferase n=1 Tax=Lacunisphaera limnophila TaxID=1838286 RepID=A0A1D8AXE7_9BACT|nr:UDPGP type 1 family protein [Lacunisphaera limnophila]AOS45553.1 putative uridylyltransferase [Lacunisphaera limnophila]